MHQEERQYKFAQIAAIKALGTVQNKQIKRWLLTIPDTFKSTISPNIELRIDSRRYKC